MRINEFEVNIHPGTETTDGYIEMYHNTQYTLALTNHKRVRCDAQVEIDGKPVGAWRIPAGQTIRLERPVHDTGRFTFYKMGTPEAAQAQLQYHNKLGLVQVTFTPEKRRPVYRPAMDAMEAESLCESAGGSGSFKSKCARSAGGSGLSGRSSQRFGVADQIEYDYSQQTVISLRLVCREPYVDDIRPLNPAPHANPVPLPVK